MREPAMETSFQKRKNVAREFAQDLPQVGVSASSVTILKWGNAFKRGKSLDRYVIAS